MGGPPSAVDDGDDDDVFFELLNRVQWARRELAEIAAFLIYEKYPHAFNITTFFRHPPGLNLIAASPDCRAFRGERAVFSRRVLPCGSVQLYRRSNDQEMYTLLPNKTAFGNSPIGLVAILHAFAHHRNKYIFEPVQHHAINQRETAKVSAIVSALTHHRVQHNEFQFALWYLQKLVTCFAAAYKQPILHQCTDSNWQQLQETTLMFHRMMLRFDRWITDLLLEPGFSLPPGTTLECVKNGMEVSLEFASRDQIRSAERTSRFKYDAVNVLNAIRSATSENSSLILDWPNSVLAYRKGGPPPTQTDIEDVRTMLEAVSKTLCERYRYRLLQLDSLGSSSSTKH